MQLAAGILTDQYEQLYERVKVKEAFLMKIYSRQQEGSANGKVLQSASVDETETIVDTLSQYREAFNLYLELALSEEHKDLVKEVNGGI